MNLLDLAILTLAAYRITRMVTTDHIFQPIRERIWNRYDPSAGRPNLGYLITCEWCMSIWIASSLLFVYTIASETTIIGSCIFAISALVGLLYRID